MRRVTNQLQTFFKEYTKLPDKEDEASEIEVFLIENILKFYEKAKELCQDSYYDYSIFEYMKSLLLLLHTMEIDKFLGDKEFYKNFMVDHVNWVKELIRVSKITEEAIKKSDEGKWRSLAMKDHSKLESLRNHLMIVKEEKWKEFIKFFKN